MKHHLTFLFAGLLTASALSSGVLLRSASAEHAAVAPMIAASEVFAQSGETVTVELAVQNNPGIAALSLNIEYDPQKLTLLDASNQADWSNAVFISGGDKTVIPYTLNWDTDGSVDYAADCVLATLQFAIKNGASGDAAIGVQVNQESTFHADFSEAKFDTQNGIVHIGAITTTSPETTLVTTETSTAATNTTTASTNTTTLTTVTTPTMPEPLRGDIDGNGSVDVIDAQIALKAYVELMADNPSGLSEMAFHAADVDRSGDLSVTDAQYILQYYTLNTLSAKPTAWEEIISR